MWKEITVKFHIVLKITHVYYLIYLSFRENDQHGGQIWLYDKSISVIRKKMLFCERQFITDSFIHAYHINERKHYKLFYQIRFI